MKIEDVLGGNEEVEAKCGKCYATNFRVINAEGKEPQILKYSQIHSITTRQLGMHILFKLFALAGLLLLAASFSESYLPDFGADVSFLQDSVFRGAAAGVFLLPLLVGMFLRRKEVVLESSWEDMVFRARRPEKLLEKIKAHMLSEETGVIEVPDEASEETAPATETQSPAEEETQAEPEEPAPAEDPAPKETLEAAKEKFTIVKNDSCSACGAIVAEGLEYCPGCGKKVVRTSKGEKEEKEEPKGGKNLCDKCGAEIPADAKFCMKCGQKVGQSIQQEDPPAEEPKEETQEEEPGEEAVEGTRICSSCHSEIPKQAYVCPNCGKS